MHECTHTYLSMYVRWLWALNVKCPRKARVLKAWSPAAGAPGGWWDCVSSKLMGRLNHWRSHNPMAFLGGDRSEESGSTWSLGLWRAPFLSLPPSFASFLLQSPLLSPYPTSWLARGQQLSLPNASATMIFCLTPGSKTPCVYNFWNYKPK